jgi:hypothetical protein
MPFAALLVPLKALDELRMYLGGFVVMFRPAT